MKTINEIIEWIDDEINNESDAIKDSYGDNNHMRTAALASRDTLINLLDFIKEDL